jgi:hypothetical protein
MGLEFFSVSFDLRSCYFRIICFEMVGISSGDCKSISKRNVDMGVISLWELHSSQTISTVVYMYFV